MSGISPNSVAELWRALQTAYSRYKNASATLDALLTVSTGESPWPDRNLHIEAATTIQRTTFEEYIEARLQLSEFLGSEQNCSSLIPTTPEHRTLTSGLTVSRKTLVPTVAVLLILTILGTRELAEERWQIRNLEGAREEANAALIQRERQIQVLTGQIEALDSASLAVTGSNRLASVLGQRPLPHHSVGKGKIVRKHQQTIQGRRKWRAMFHPLEALRARRPPQRYGA